MTKTIAVAKTYNPYSDPIEPYLITNTDNMIIKNKHSTDSTEQNNSKRARTDNTTESSATIPSLDEINKIQLQLDNYDIELHHNIHILEYQSYNNKKSLYEQRDTLLSTINSNSILQTDNTDGFTNIWSIALELLLGQLIDEIDSELLDTLKSLCVVEHEPTKTTTDEYVVYSSAFTLKFEFDSTSEYIQEHLHNATITKKITYTQRIGTTDKSIAELNSDKTNATQIEFSVEPQNIWKSQQFVTENHDSFFVNFFTNYNSHNNTTDSTTTIPAEYQLQISESLRKDVYPDVLRYIEQASNTTNDDMYSYDDAEQSNSEDSEIPELVE